MVAVKTLSAEVTFFLAEPTALVAEVTSLESAEARISSAWSVSAFEAPGVKVETPRVEFRTDAGIGLEDDKISRCFDEKTRSLGDVSLGVDSGTLVDSGEQILERKSRWVPRSMMNLKEIV
jgi:hypothetical protein